MPFSNFYNTSLDSYKIWIPIEIINLTEKGKEDFNSKIHFLNTTTGELGEEYKKKCYKAEELEKSGISLSFLKVVQEYKEKCMTGKKITKNFMTILINSKILKAKYFKGITKENIREIYNIIIEQGIFTCSFNDFIQSGVTDCDIKTDIKMDKKDLKPFLKEINKRLTNGYLRIKGKKQRSITFSKRHRTGKTVTEVYIKFYSKLFELLNNSNLFYDAFLKGQYIDYLRLEGTIKDKGHFKSLLKSINQPEKEMTLENLLDVPEENKLDILKSMLGNYNTVKDRPYLKGAEKVLKTQDKLLYMSLKMWFTLGHDFKDYLLDIKPIYEGKHFYKVKKRAEELYTLIKKDPEMKDKISNNSIINFLLV